MDVLLANRIKYENNLELAISVIWSDWRMKFNFIERNPFDPNDLFKALQPDVVNLISIDNCDN